MRPPYPFALLLAVMLAGCGGNLSSSSSSSGLSSGSAMTPDQLVPLSLHVGDQAVYRVETAFGNATLEMSLGALETALRADASWKPGILVRVNASAFTSFGFAVPKEEGQERSPGAGWDHWLSLDGPEILNSLKDGRRPNEPSGFVSPVGYHAFASVLHPCYMSSVDPVLLAAMPLWYFQGQAAQYNHLGCSIQVGAIARNGTATIRAEPPADNNFGLLQVLATFEDAPFPQQIQLTYDTSKPMAWKAALLRWSQGSGPPIMLKPQAPEPMAALPLAGQLELRSVGAGEILIPPMQATWPDAMNTTAALEQFVGSPHVLASFLETPRQLLDNFYAYSFYMKLGIVSPTNPGDYLAGEWHWRAAPNPTPNDLFWQDDITLIEFPSFLQPTFEPVGQKQDDAGPEFGSGVTYEPGIPLVKLSDAAAWLTKLRGDVPVDFIGWFVGSPIQGNPPNGHWILTAGCSPHETRAPTSLVVNPLTGLLEGAFVNEWPGAGIAACHDTVYVI